MNNTCDQLIRGLQETFPEAESLTLSEQSTLGELPEWDSMAAVNLQTYLQQQFQLEMPLEFLVDETRIDEIAAFIESNVGTQVAS
jgi:acyl carrier protein